MKEIGRLELKFGKVQPSGFVFNGSFAKCEDQAVEVNQAYMIVGIAECSFCFV